MKYNRPKVRVGNCNFSSVSAKVWVGTVWALVMGMAGPVAAQCIEFNADLQQGAFLWGKVEPGSRVQLNGKPLDVMADGVTFIGFGRDAAESAELVVTGQQTCRETLKIGARNYRIQRVEGVPPETVTPPAEQLERIRREAAQVRAARAQRLQPPGFPATIRAGFSWPVKGPISGVYGSQRFYNGQPRRPHYGVDVAAAAGTTVRAPAAGRVTLAEPDLFYSGGTVILDHGYLLSSSFLHLEKVLVAVGDELAPGDIVGAVGATGRATGPHLDWRMNWRDQRVDPQLLVPPMPKP
ncbi:MAG: M23 family metallopeptidase [Halieaceae bacterium]|jgi:murein DD-endopeptidase MepM/ murein hydrolase activator NlpD|nr:M23 family metallopeptidase [Halieaceae bacterium]